MKIIIIGDIYGKTGRRALREELPRLKAEYRADIVIVNGENAAGGTGLTKKIYDELKASGADIITTGNHIWDKREIFDFIDDEPYLVRPANYPPGVPGRGWCSYQWQDKKLAVINLSGRTFMPEMDCPFQKVDSILAEIQAQCNFIILDFHAETTSEKMAMGWYLDGRASCVVGTHTHIQTADERILPQGTAYITDLGMTGPWNSVLGVDKDIIIKSFLRKMPIRFEMAKGPYVLSGVFVELDDNGGNAVKIERILQKEAE